MNKHDKLDEFVQEKKSYSISIQDFHYATKPSGTTTFIRVELYYVKENKEKVAIICTQLEIFQEQKLFVFCCGRFSYTLKWKECNVSAIASDSRAFQAVFSYQPHEHFFELLTSMNFKNESNESVHLLTNRIK